VIEHALRDFRLAGVALDGEKKERFKALMLELSRLGAKFEENVLDATNAFSLHVTDEAELAGINATIVAQARERAAKADKVGWLFGLDQPTYVAIVTDAHSAALRRAFYEAWATRASDQGPSANRFDNTPIIEDLLRLRHETARLLDFPNYAAYALATRMAKSVDEVLAFIRAAKRGVAMGPRRDATGGSDDDGE
jgi:oligopeptidase A